MGMNSSIAVCPMCERDGSVVLTCRVRNGKHYRLARCRECGQHFCDPPPTAEEIRNFYQGEFHRELRENGQMEVLFRDKFTRYRDWTLHYLQGGRSVDIGTATGLFPSLLKASGFDAEGTEYNAASAEWGAKQYGIRIRIGGAELLDGESEGYDFISMTDVLEHTEHPLKTLKDVARALRPRGYMLITFPDIRSLESSYLGSLSRLTGRDWIWSCCNIPLHTWEFTPKTARAMFKMAGFDVVGFRRWQVAPDQFRGAAKLISLPLGVLMIPVVARVVGTQMEFMIRRND